MESSTERRIDGLSIEQMRRLIPKDAPTQDLIAHFAEEIYNARMYFKLNGDNLSDWLAAEDKYIRVFLKRRAEDRR